MSKPKILVNTPALYLSGGVANHYKGLREFWKLNVRYNYVGGRKGIPRPIILVYDYIKFLFLCCFGDFEIIILNPSLGRTAIMRDALFLKIAKIFKLRTVLFFHGWDIEMVERINRNPKKFRNTFDKADTILVLAQGFKNDLLSWGITKPIFLTTTKVNDMMIEGFCIDSKVYDQRILFLTRIEKYKGIDVTIQVYKLIKEKFPEAQLIVAGDGTELKKTKKLVNQENIQEVTFLGNVKGKELINAFKNASLYILPSHSEGMPTSVLEAMAFGLPIISRPVGGLVDFFEQGKMGYLIESFEPSDYAEKIIELFEESNKCKVIGKYNHEYAQKYFMASKVAKNIETFINYEPEQ